MKSAWRVALVLILIWVLGAATVLAQEAQNSDDAPRNPPRAAQGFGFAGGPTAGLGFSYRQHFENGFGVQAAGIGFGHSDFLFMNAGGEVLYTVASAWLVRFYVLGGLMGVYMAERDWDSCYEAGNTDCENRELPFAHNFLFTPGAGWGMEFHFTRHIGLALELPLSVWIPIGNGRLEGDGIQILPVPNAALTYYF
jgi:hypothetical protein